MVQATLRLEKNVRRGREVRLVVDGAPVVAYEGESVAAALLATGRRAIRQTAKGEPRGVFCGIGLCFECVVTVEGAGRVRACVTPVRDGMQVTTIPSSVQSRG